MSIGKLKQNISKNDLLSHINLITLILLIAVFYIINPSFLNNYNLKTLLISMAPLLVMACGATYVRLLGSLDLSMGAVCSCANVLLVTLFPYTGFVSYIIVAIFGILSGLILGFVHTRYKVPSFILSLGMMNVYSSIALLIMRAPVPVPKEERYLIDWGKISFGIFNLMTIMALIIMIIFYFIQKATPFGRSLNLIGANERAARISGVNIRKTKIIAFMMCGMTSAIAGMMLTAKLKSADPAGGNAYTLLAVASVLLGGTSMTGGTGSILKTLVGVSMVTIINNGMTIIGVDAFWSQIVFGSLILLSMVLTTDKKSRNLVVK